MLISMEGAPEHQRTAATNSSKNKEIHAIFCQAHAVAALQRLFFEALRNGQAGITSPRCWGLERFWGAFIPNTPNTPNTSERLSTVTLSSCHMTGTNLLRPQYVFFSMASWAVNGLWGCKWCSCRGTAATTGRVSQLRRDKSTGFTWFHTISQQISADFVVKVRAFGWNRTILACSAALFSCSKILIAVRSRKPRRGQRLAGGNRLVGIAHKTIHNRYFRHF